MFSKFRDPKSFASIIAHLKIAQLFINSPNIRTKL